MFLSYKAAGSRPCADSNLQAASLFERFLEILQELGTRLRALRLLRETKRREAKFPAAFFLFSGGFLENAPIERRYPKKLQMEVS